METLRLVFDVVLMVAAIVVMATVAAGFVVFTYFQIRQAIRLDRDGQRLYRRNN